MCIVFFYNKQTPPACGCTPFPIVTILVRRTESLGLFQNDSLLPPCVARGFSSGLHCENPGALEGELTKVRICPPKTRPSGVQTLRYVHIEPLVFFQLRSVLLPSAHSHGGFCSWASGLVTCDSWFAPAMGLQLAQ